MWELFNMGIVLIPTLWQKISKKIKRAETLFYKSVRYPRFERGTSPLKDYLVAYYRLVDTN